MSTPAACRCCKGQTVPPCCLLSDGLRQELVVAGPERLAPGAIIFNSGDANDRLGLILSGKVALVRPDAGTLCELGKGDIVGDLFASRAILAAHAIGEVLLCRLDRRQLIGAIDHTPDLLRFFLAGTRRWLAAARQAP
ncbi:cyclic nucleotide-binding domain-containing protein [Sphingomicrobium aestuariivivum]|uniref:cyclic nucleotide-binding domain-containing protein n=1 Tax=Sphingomicrobium aestuariivivum TaxID=1582356 RepID=UPI001FD71B97|nr:cyclic nucleotide-binding domain-containing protein [Sphingomicrobium aestuariivivum]MCJ8191283.1 cyclic nucleotide-binding domain-containing protein [Sphingomicrobium aestuariivivum]